MGHFLYCAGDAPFVAGLLDFCQHMQECENCRKLADDDEGREQIDFLFSELNRIAAVDIPLGDYAAACEFCERWFSVHDLLMLIDFGGGDNGTIQ